MKNFISSTMLCVAGAIHLIPVSGLLGQSQLTSLYGIQFQEPNILILMRHRAVLFGLVGGFMIKAAFQKSIQNIAICSGLMAAGSYLYIAMDVKGYNSKLHRVFVADVAAVGCLLIAAVSSNI